MFTGTGTWTISYRMPDDSPKLARRLTRRYRSLAAVERREEKLTQTGALAVRSTYRGPCAACERPTVNPEGYDHCPACIEGLKNAEFSAGAD